MRRVLAVLVSVLIAVWPLLLPQPVSANPCANNVKGVNLTSSVGKNMYVDGDNKQEAYQDADGGDSEEAESEAEGGKGDSGYADSGKADSGKADGGKGDSGYADSGKVEQSNSENEAETEKVGAKQESEAENEVDDIKTEAEHKNIAGDAKPETGEAEAENEGGNGGDKNDPNNTNTAGTGTLGTLPNIVLDLNLLAKGDSASVDADGGKGFGDAYSGKIDDTVGGDAYGDNENKTANFQNAESENEAEVEAESTAVQANKGHSGDATSGWAKGGSATSGWAKSGDATSGYAKGGRATSGDATSRAGDGGTARFTGASQTGHTVDMSGASSQAGDLNVSGEPCKNIIEGDVIGSQVLSGVNTIQNSVMQNVSAQVGNAAAGAINLGQGANNGIPDLNSPYAKEALGYGGNVNVNLNPNNNQNTNFISIGGQ